MNGSFIDLLVFMDGGIDEIINIMVWRGMYKVIGEINVFIVNIVDSLLELVDKLLMEVVVCFLCVLVYYNLVVIYGDVFLKIIFFVYDGVVVFCFFKNEVFELVCIDWEFVYENLLEKDDDGFVMKWVVKVYLGKFYYILGC